MSVRGQGGLRLRNGGDPAQQAALRALQAETAAWLAPLRDGDTYRMSVDQVEELHRRQARMAALEVRAAPAPEPEPAVEPPALPVRRTEPVVDPDPEPERRGAGYRPPLGAPRSQGPQNFGDLVVESPAYRAVRGTRSNVSCHIDCETDQILRRATFSTTGGWDPEDTRTRRIVWDEQEMPRVVDLYPHTRTRQSSVLWMEETTYTNTAAEVSEAGTAPEATLVYTEQSSEVRRIAVSLPVTEEVLEDEQRARQILNNRLRNMIMQRLDQQILTGNGTAPNLRGVNNVTNINTQAKGTDPITDAIYKGIVLCRVNGFVEPSGIVMHPNDWQDYRLLRTADGVYINGSPSEVGVNRIWGLPVVITTYQTEGTAVVGDFRNYAELVMRRGVDVEFSNSHGTRFTEGVMTLLATLRAAVIHYRAKAFCKVTGL